MATNKRDLKAYVRFDGTGRIVPGSLVLRRTKPKVGNWKEIEAYECCFLTSTTTTTVAPTTTTTTTIPLGCFLTTDVSNFTYPTTAIFFNINIPNESNCESYQDSAFSLEDTPIVINNINDLVQVLNDTLYFPNPFGSFFISGPNQISLLFNEDLNYVCDCILSSISITNL